MIQLRPLTIADIPNLQQIRPTYRTSTILTSTILVVEKTGSGLEITWRLVERERIFDKKDLYDFLPDMREQIRERLLRPDETYQRVAEENDRLVGLLDIEIQRWNNTALLWNLMIDLDYRQQGIGRRLWNLGVNFARQAGVRAVMIETQNTNIAACRFYARLECQLIGLNEMLYANRDEDHETALFWAYPL
jgi:ribosomal protein S18 acetylase RimI-like enzyme